MMWRWALVLFGFSGVAWFQLEPRSKETMLPYPKHQGFALVELFTSEGCSSCPAADRYLSELTMRAQSQDLAIFTLSFHVDYWDYLGWQDPFAKAEFTHRQRAYARFQSEARVYTPQMMVNGVVAFVGSDRQAGERALTWAFTNTTPSAKQLGLSLVMNGSKLTVTYQVDPKFKRHHLNLGVVESPLPHKVLRGENHGRQLQHTHVVRVFTSRNLTKTGHGSVVLVLPQSMQHGKGKLIGYVQEKGPGRVVAATLVAL